MFFYFKKLFFSVAKWLTMCHLLLCVYHMNAQGTPSSDSTETEEIAYKLRFLDVSIDRVYPVNSYGRNLERNLTGATLSYLMQLKKKKLDYLGFQANFAFIGSNSNDFPDANVRTTSYVFGSLLMYRHFPDLYFWKIEPFIEAALGPQFYVTQTTTNFFDESESANVDFDEFDTSIAYGLGIGFTLHIYSSTFFFTKFSYFGGTAVTYLVDRDNQFPFPLDNFRPETTQTNYLKAQFGFTFSL